MANNQWSVEEIEANATNWSLEGDDQILRFMQSISENLERRGSHTKNRINKLTLSAHDTSIRLNNVHNKLLALQQQQFVENRVYDEDETVSNRDDVPILIESNKEQLTPEQAITLALNKSIETIENIYEEIEINLDDDSDDEDMMDKKSIVYRRKNSDQNLLLPYTIGSKEWREKLYLGLMDSDDEKSDDDDIEEYSESSDETISRTASIPSMAAINKENNLVGQVKIMDSTSESNLSIDDNSILQEQAKQIKHSVENTPAIFENKITPNLNEVIKQEVQRITQNQNIKRPSTFVANLFSDEPPALDFPPIEKSNPVNLFLDSDDDNDMDNNNLFNTNSKPFNNHTTSQKDAAGSISSKGSKTISSNTSSTKNKPNQSATSNTQEIVEKNPSNAIKNDPIIPRKTVNLFDDDDFDSFMNVLDESKSKKPMSKLSSIFDDTPPDDLFDVLITNQRAGKNSLFEEDTNESKTNQQTDKPIKGSTNLFDDDFETNANTSNTSKVNNVMIVDNKKPSIKISQGVSKNNQTVVKSTKHNIFDDSDDDNSADDDFPIKSNEINKISNINDILKTDNIFDDEKIFDDEPVFESDYIKTEPIAELPKSEQSPKQNVSKKMPITLDEQDGAQVNKDTTPPPEDDEFSQIPSDQQISESQLNPPVIDSFTDKDDKNKSLFDDSTKSADSNIPSKLFDIDLFNDSVHATDHEADDELFKTNRILSEAENNHRTSISPPSFDAKTTKSYDFSNTIGLFDDIPPPDDDEQFFASIHEQNVVNVFDDYVTDSFQATSKTSGSEFLFNDEPPPDEPDENIEKNTDEIDRSTMLDGENSFNSKISLFSKPSSIDSLPPPSSGDESIPISKPKKLASNLNINVMALLPGAKGPLTKTIKHDVPNTNRPSVGLETASVAKEEHYIKTNTSVPDLPIEKHDSPSINHTDTLLNASERLVSLAKTRPKIQVSRRKSTRQARQMEYRKSLALQENDNQNIINENDSHESNEQINNQSEDPISILHPKTDVESHKKSTRKTFIFYNDEDDISGTIDNGRTENNVNDHPNILPEKTQQTDKKSKLNTANIWDDDDDDSDIFGKIKQQSKREDKLNKMKQNDAKIDESIQITRKAVSLFSDEDDDDDDLFSKITKKTLPTATVKTSAKMDQQVIKSIPTKSKLFADTSDDDENIFGESASMISKRKQNSIDFESSNKVKSKPSNSIKKTSLFNDSDENADDDDDLFSTKSKVKKTQTTVNVKGHKKSTTKLTEPKLGNEAIDDPLADLLKSIP